MLAAKALASLRRCADLPERLLLADMIRFEITCTDPIVHVFLNNVFSFSEEEVCLTEGCVLAGTYTI